MRKRYGVARNPLTGKWHVIAWAGNEGQPLYARYNSKEDALQAAKSQQKIENIEIKSVANISLAELSACDGELL